MSEIPDPVGLKPLVVDEDQTNEFPDLIKLGFVFELRTKASSMTTMPLKSSKLKTSLIGPLRFVRLIFIYFMSEVSGRSGPEIRSTDLQLLQEVAGRSGQGIGTDLHLPQVQGLRPIGSGNSDKTYSQKRPLGFPSYMKPIL